MRYKFLFDVFKTSKEYKLFKSDKILKKYR